MGYFFLTLAVALIIFSPLVADPDLWGHVRFGQDALLSGQIVRSDTYSYLTTGQRWINHEWLTEILYALAYNAGSAAGLIATNTVLSLLVVGLIFARLQRARMGAVGAALLIVGVSLVLRPSVLNIRPQVFTYLCFLLLLLLIAAYTENPGRMGAVRLVAGVCALFALWVNLHGGVLAGVGVLYLWGVVYLVEGGRRPIRSSRPDRSVVAVLLLAPMALLLNPYGPDLLAFLLRTATVARPEIVEWQPVRLDDVWGWYWLGAVGVTLAAVGLSRRPRRACLLVPLAVLGLLPLSALRHLPLFAVAAPVLAAEHFADLWDRVASRVAAGAALLAVGAAIVLVGLAAPRLQQIVILPVSAGFPVNAVAVLEAAGVRGNMATEFNWGEYVLWRVGPGIKVSVDGRRETVYPEAIYRENLDFMRGEGQWDRLIDRPETDLALVDRERPAYGLMQGKVGWLLAYEDTAAAVFVREGSPWLDAIERVEPPLWPADGEGLGFPAE